MESSERRRRRRYRPLPPYGWPPFFNPYYRWPPEVLYPPPEYNRLLPRRMRPTPEEEIALLEDALKDLEDEKADILEHIEELKREAKRRKGKEEEEV